MSEETPKTKTEQLEELRKSKLEDRAKAEAEQYEKDLEARIALEDEYGTIVAVKMVRFTPGQPTAAFLRTPRASEYKRFKDQVHRAVEKKNIQAQGQASELLARACWVYPAEKEAQDAMLEVFPGLLTPLANAAAALAQGVDEDQGKG